MRTDWREIWALYAAGVTAAYQFGKVAVVAGELRAELGLTLAGIGWAVSLVNLLGVGLGAAAGAWADRIGTRRALVLGLAATALAGAAQAAAPDAALLLAARAVEGLGYLVVVVAAPTLIARRAADGDRVAALALWATFVPVGFALANALSGLLAGPLGWRGLFLLDAALPAAAAAGVLLAVAGTPPAAVRVPGTAIYREPGPVWLGLGFCCYTLGLQAFLAFLPVRLVEAEGLDLAVAGTVAGSAAAASVAGTVAAGALMARGLGLPALAAAGLLGSALASAAVHLPAGAPAAVVGAVAFMIMAGLVPAVVFAGLPRVAAPAAIGPANGLIVQTGNLGSLLGPPAVAAWVGVLGWERAPLFLAILAGLGTACLAKAFQARHAAA
ncbi:MFS transporter [Arenibaculum sp.]|jgi:predicted MFS family arabinose efflux permease|uniref:MFS transporter n=1 Tax=Arenibaculum sp. TaxID=2865862 RepID=UPI002E0EFFEE|nr:MFS transporter [Arenibaculum sp.]